MGASDFVLVNGVKMTTKEYKEMMKAKLGITNKPKPKRRKKQETEIRILGSDIRYMVKSVKLINSLSAYYDNAYRQWGVIGRDLVNHRDIRPHFVLYRMKAREITNKLNDITDMAKRNSKAIYQEIENLSYKLDDIKQIIDNLSSGIVKSGLMDLYKDKEFICGAGRRLGIQTLVSRSCMAIKQINDVIRKCQKSIK